MSDFYIDTERHLVVNLPISGQQVRLRPPTGRDNSFVSVLVSEGLDGKKLTDFDAMVAHIARLLTPVAELKKDENAWRDRFDALIGGYDFDGEDLEALLEAFTSFRALRLSGKTIV